MSDYSALLLQEGCRNSGASNSTGTKHRLKRSEVPRVVFALLVIFLTAYYFHSKCGQVMAGGDHNYTFLDSMALSLETNGSNATSTSP